MKRINRNMIIVMQLALCACAQRPASNTTKVEIKAPEADKPTVIAAAPGTDINIKPANPETGEKPKVSITTPAAPALPPTRPLGTIEMDGFKPIHENLGQIKRVKADRITTDASGLMTLTGNAVVEVQQGQAVARLTSDEIKIQTGPGFKAQVVGATAD